MPPALRSLDELALVLDVDPVHLVPYGRDKAKVSLQARRTGGSRGRLILVSAITPTDAGEGKTTTSIGLAGGLACLGERACLALREPSLGPAFGRKGGATGGGRARLHPADDINLHFTGDMHAVGAAHNLLAAMVDNHIHHGNAADIDPRRVHWRRAIDVNDRALRNVVIGLGGVLQGVPRETGFDITPASEVMAALCLAEDEADLRARLSRLVVALTHDLGAVTAADVGAVGAMMVLLRDAVMPNLVQTSEGVPAFVHGGPFANIAHGCNSILATKMALEHADWVVTEAGFGFDLGAEKFFDIVCASGGLDTAAVVLVATVRALKRHGGTSSELLTTPDPGAVERGLPNLVKHVESIRTFGEVPVVALNRFPADTHDEISVVRRACEALGAPMAVSDVFARGGEGGRELAEAVRSHAERHASPFRPLYDAGDPFKVKLRKIASAMYGAAGIEYTRTAEGDLTLAEHLGYGHLPVCVAKTQKSLSDDPKRAGRPEDFELTVRSVLLAAGAGYLVPLMGDIVRMPGLPASPQAERIDLVDGRVVGMEG